ncbi:XTP/dITP diphosphatase [Desulfoluna sp.]|uniref:XTP/dITP diphosphatase n=1 Tax=Desulfoluna sp. TaxID=2045199 RepID=UPI00260503A7|nr:XTP/dITP diphosphatase [Desulfoluna sp.]
MDKPVVLVLATRNKGKTEEIRALLSGFPVVLKNLDDFGPIPEVIEDGETFDDNAYKKASFTARVLGFPAIADDSGLVVEALNGEPGVYSARYAGEDADDAANNTKLLEKMAGVEDRRAAFQCVLSIAVPTGPALTYEGRCDGVIAQAPSGDGGFGYDPLFYCPEKGKTFAELTLEEKGTLSHRGRALKEVAEEFDKILTWLDLNLPVRERFECTD